MEFLYTALDGRGAQIRQQIEADSADVALDQLHNQGLVVLALEARRTRSRSGKINMPVATVAQQTARDSLRPARHRFGERRVRTEQIVALTHELSILIETGVPIVEAVDLLMRDEPHPRIREALRAFKEGISEGRGLADSMQRYPDIFPSAYVRMVRTAEVGGNLDITLARAARYVEDQYTLKRQVNAAMAYPKILMVITGGVILFMLLFLIPRFGELFIRMHAPMPFHTRLLLGCSSMLRQHWWNTPVLLLSGALGQRLLLRNPLINSLFGKLLLRLPIAGDLICKIEMVRLLQTLGMLLDSGVPLLIALETAGQTLQHSAFIRAVQEASRQIAEGKPIAAALGATHTFPTTLCQMAAVGEKAGQLSSVLLRMAEHYEQEVSSRLKSLNTILEPLMIVFLGVVVGLVAVSIIDPIYSLMDGIK